MKVAARWGIGEWYGKDIGQLLPEERARMAEFALKLTDVDPPICPFMNTVSPGSRCNKEGGVCSMRLYMDEPVRLVDAQPATTCPSRFLEKKSEGTIFTQVAKVLFDSSEDIWVIKEMPFLQKINKDGSKERSAKAGRIDWVVTSGKPIDATQPIEWAAVETQAVYFSGGKFEPDFESYLEAPFGLNFPNGKRRPDYRSSGAKRLAPQLDVKVPVMRRWGKKTVVVIDEGFADEMSPIDVISDDVDGSEVVLAVVAYTHDMRLQLKRVVLTELQSIVSALQATAPIGKSDFENELKIALSDPNSLKVHRAD